MSWDDMICHEISHDKIEVTIPQAALYICLKIMLKNIWLGPKREIFFGCLEKIVFQLKL
jgi:hypothetical protein